MKSIFTLSLVLACHLLAGCVTHHARCVFSVANASDTVLSSVLLRDEAGAAYTFATLKPHSLGPFVHTRADMGGPLTLEATTENGVTVTNTVHLDSPILRTFNGQIVFQIESNTHVRVFVQPAHDNSSNGELPWAIPPSWQGNPSIPGLSGRE